MDIETVFQSLPSEEQAEVALTMLLKHTLDTMHFVKQNHAEGDIDDREYDVIARWLQRRVAKYVSKMRTALGEVK